VNYIYSEFLVLFVLKWIYFEEINTKTSQKRESRFLIW